MYRIIYERDDGRRCEMDCIDVATFAEVQQAIEKLLNDTAVTDIYLCRQIYHINAIAERRNK